MRRLLDFLYDSAAALAALFMVGLLGMVLLSIASRQFHLHVPGTDAYAGYLMAAAGFLALAHTLKRGEHIRVTLLLNFLKGGAKKAFEIWALAIATLLAVLFAVYSCRLAWQSHEFHDISTGSDATPLWIPQIAMAGLLVLSLFLILGSGVWIGLTLSCVAWIGMQLFSSRPAGDAMAVTIWGSASSWTLTALPLFIWMGEILFRTRLSQDMFKGLAPWVQALPGRLLHTNVVGCTIFAAVSGSSAATCATIGKMTLPELTRRGYPEHMVVGTLAGASTLGLLIPPSIIMIVYGVSAEVSISQLFIAGVLPGILLAALFSGYIMVWALRHPDQIPAADVRLTFAQKLAESRSLIPVVLLIAAGLGSIYTGFATATEAAAVGVVGSLVLSSVQGSMSWSTFKESLMGATRLYCMIALILAGAAFLTLSMGYIGLPRHLAEWIASLGLNQGQLLVAIHSAR